jgi:hypothetical protein
VKQLTTTKNVVQFIGNECFIFNGKTKWKIAEWNGRPFEMCEYKTETVFTVKESKETDKHYVHE